MVVDESSQTLLLIIVFDYLYDFNAVLIYL